MSMTTASRLAPSRGAIKYDLLAALSASALQGGAIGERLALRLMILITARYNWARDELSIGRAEIARLWSVDERTVKRELAKLKAVGFLIVKRPGVRGRVTLYGLGVEAIRGATRDSWDRLGPDFAERLGASPEASPSASAITPEAAMAGAPSGQGPADWERMRLALAKRNPNRFACWFRPLSAEADGEGGLILSAPTAFHADYLERHYAQDLRAAAIEAGVRMGGLRVRAPA